MALGSQTEYDESRASVRLQQKTLLRGWDTFSGGGVSSRGVGIVSSEGK